MTRLRVIFMGTPDFAVPALAAIGDAGHDIVAVYTQPPRPAGRGMTARRSAVHDFAVQRHYSVHTPSSLKYDDVQAAFAGHNGDVAVVAAYGLILPIAVLEAPAHGCLNIHGSLLPRWRVAAPVQRAIMAGDDRTGISIMRMDEGLDTGPVCLTRPLDIAADMTDGELHDVLARMGAEAIVASLEALAGGRLDCRPQPDDGIAYAAKITKTEARIDWSAPATDVHNRIRGLSPWPGAWFEVPRNGRTVRVKALKSRVSDKTGRPGEVLDDELTVACGEGAVRLYAVQREGRGVMTADELLRGLAIAPGTRL